MRFLFAIWCTWYKYVKYAKIWVFLLSDSFPSSANLLESVWTVVLPPPWQWASVHPGSWILYSVHAVQTVHCVTVRTEVEVRCTNDLMYRCTALYNSTSLYNCTQVKVLAALASCSVTGSSLQPRWHNSHLSSGQGESENVCRLQIYNFVGWIEPFPPRMSKSWCIVLKHNNDSWVLYWYWR